MANVNPYSSIWYNIPNKELYYEGLALNKECFSILESESISVENPVRKNFEEENSTCLLLLLASVLELLLAWAKRITIGRHSMVFENSSKLRLKGL